MCHTDDISFERLKFLTKIFVFFEGNIIFITYEVVSVSSVKFATKKQLLFVQQLPIYDTIMNKQLITSNKTYIILLLFSYFMYQLVIYME